MTDNRYARHTSLTEIGEAGQKKIRRAKVLIIGAGGLGCPTMLYLAAAGVGTIGIIDGDKIDESNLQRQVVYQTAEIGTLKVAAAKKAIENRNPDVIVRTFPYFLTERNALSLLFDFDIIIDGSDNFATRYLVNDACVILNKPLVFASIFKFEGQVTVFNYQGSATYRCLYPTPPDPTSVPSCGEVGVLGVLPGIMGTYQALETLKIITGIGNVLTNQLLCIDTLSHTNNIIRYHLDAKHLEQAELLSDYAYFCNPNHIEELDRNTLEQLQQQEEVVLLDVREIHEYNSYNIGGYNLPLSQLARKLGQLQLPEESIVVTICQSGIRSKKAILLLKEQFPNSRFYSVKGGLVTW